MVKCKFKCFRFYFKTSDGTFSASVVQLLNPDEIGEKFAWAAITVYWIVNADEGTNELAITFSERNIFTWEDSFGDEAITNPTICSIRYPDAYLFL